MAKKTSSLQKILIWLDEHILLLLSSFLIIFIPLYPKLPLFDLIPGYLVRVRLEDIFILITCIIWFIQVLRKKVRWQNPLSWIIVSYIFFAFLSVLSALFLIKTVPFELIHFGKTFLHFLRYIEYFSLFFILFATIKSHKQVKIIITVFALTVGATAIYGWGQKYYYWPVYSTMNREFSKGMRLYLTEHARVQSTFGGHYDLAAFLVIALCFLLSLAYKEKDKYKKIFYHLIHVAGLWLMIVAASRTSFFAYLVGAVLVIIMVASGKKKLKAKLQWGFSRLFLLILTISILSFYFGQDMIERFVQVFDSYPAVSQTYHLIDEKKDELGDWLAVITKSDQKQIKKPKNGISVEELQKQLDEEGVLVPSDQRPIPKKPSDVYVDVPNLIRVATISATGEKIFIMVERERTWSENALKHGLSMAIRLDTLWPNAIDGFLKNPILGSGYATLNKESFLHFTEAESTDNNFLRTLGETGLMGFIFFYGNIIACIGVAARFIKNKNYLTSALSIGFVAASIALLINALYIDVFAASKVALIYWALTGMMMGLYYLKENRGTLKKHKLLQKINKFFSNVVKKFKIKCH